MRTGTLLCIALTACGVDAPVTNIGEKNAPMSPLDLRTNRAKQETCDTSTNPVASTCADVGFAPDTAQQEFRHWKNKLIAKGNPKHRSVDLIVKPGAAQSIVAKIAYDFLDVDLQDEVVEIWAQTACDKWTKLGTTLTTDGNQPAFEGIEDDGGRVFFRLQAPLPQGDYRIRLLVKGDHTTADSWLHVWPLGTPVVVADIDGTMTAKESDGLWSVFNPAAADAQPAAADMMQAYYAKGYRVVFVTARPEFLNNGTKQWLTSNGFPPFTLHTSQSNFGESGPPAYQYKLQYLTQLQNTQGMSVAWAYGNKDTDLNAYIESGAQHIVLISGQYTGELKGATMVDDYVDEAHRVGCAAPL